MQFYQTLAVVAFLAGIALAAPITNDLTPRDGSVSGECTGGYRFFLDHWECSIKAKYNGGSGCNDVYNTLQKWSVSPTLWTCESGTNGD